MLFRLPELLKNYCVNFIYIFSGCLNIKGCLNKFLPFPWVFLGLNIFQPAFFKY